MYVYVGYKMIVILVITLFLRDKGNYKLNKQENARAIHTICILKKSAEQKHRWKADQQNGHS